MDIAQTLIFIAYFLLQYYAVEQNCQYPDFIRIGPYLKPLVEAEEMLYFILSELRASSIIWTEVYQHKPLDREIDRYFEDVEGNSGLNLKAYSGGNSTRKSDSSEVISEHPLLCYRLVYRFVKHVHVLLDYLIEEFEYSDYLLSKFYKVLRGAALPEEIDLDDAGADLLRILHIYDLHVDELANGIIHGKHTGYALQAKHCYEMAKFALRNKIYPYLAVEWFEFLGTLLKEPLGFQISNETYQRELDQAINFHDSEWEARPENDEKLFTFKVGDPEGEILPETNGLLRRSRRRTRVYEYYRGVMEGYLYDEINYWGLCSGDDLKKASEKAKLYCWYESKSHPAWFINPLKIELLSSTPFLIQIYEFLSEDFSDKLASHIETGRRLAKSKLYDPDKTDTVALTPSTRSSGSKWLNSTDPDSVLVSKRIEYATGLLVTPNSAAEKLQLASYSFGQHYSTHFDSLSNLKENALPENGDRIATFMIYLSGAELGGYTAFTQAQAVALPIKGSAVFWYNMHRNGTNDQSWTSHGACPVLMGNKIVANKWIRVNDQFLTRKCATDPNL